MKRTLLILTMLLCAAQSWAQLQRSDDFHAKYKLKGVAIFSRHGVRAPNGGSQYFMQNATNHTWADFTAPAEELTLKGGILETLMGQFFRKWTASEGLLSENIYNTDAEDSVFFYANSMQRTIATSNYFLAGFMPVSSLTTYWTGTFGTYRPEFYPLRFDMNDIDKVKSEIAYLEKTDTLRKLSESCTESMKLLADVLDFKDSPLGQSGGIPDFGTNPDHNSQFVVKHDTLSFSSSSIGHAFLLADPLILQSYITGDSTAFGRPLTYQQWRSIGKITAATISTSALVPSIYKPAGQHMLDSISAELKNEGRKFFFMCGHDSNISCMLKAMDVEDYTLENTIEPYIPIGAKIVFEKWADASGKEFVGVNFVYQSVKQMRSAEILTLDNPPMIVPLRLKSLTANEDALYPLDEFTDFIDNINSPTAINEIRERGIDSSIPTYNIQGQAVRSVSNGSATILISNGKKILNR